MTPPTPSEAKALVERLAGKHTWDCAKNESGPQSCSCAIPDAARLLLTTDRLDLAMRVAHGLLKNPHPGKLPDPKTDKRKPVTKWIDCACETHEAARALDAGTTPE